MTMSKDGKGASPFPDDLERNPGIGSSAGTTRAGENPEEIEGENTVEGDRENDTNPAGGIAKNDRGRDDGLS